MKLKPAYFGWSFLFCLIVLAISIEALTGYSFDFQDAESILLSPNKQHWFGTDSLGRDLFTRVFFGARVSLFVAIFSSTMTMVFGVAIGLAGGWFEGWGDRVVIRVIDIVQAIPSFLMVSLLCLFFRNLLETGGFDFKTLLAIGISISLVHWFNVAKVTRGQTKQIKSLDYVMAARALGAKDSRILCRHILPNMRGPLLVLFTLQIPASILYESMISFAGYGLQAPQVSWGILLHEGWRSLSEFPHLLLLPALVLFLTVLSFHLILTSRR